MNELLKLKRNAALLGLCSEYTERWNKAATKKDLADIALDANGIEFMADGIAFGWGLSKEFLSREFGSFANGEYTRKKDGYTSALIIDNKAKINVTTTLLLAAWCNCTLSVREGYMCKIYVCGKSCIDIHCEGTCYVYSYGENLVTHTGNGIVEYKEIMESKWR